MHDVMPDLPAVPAPNPPALFTSPERFTVVAGPETGGERVDRFLAEAIGVLSRSRVKSLIAEGRASRDAVRVQEPAEPVRPGSRYALELPPPQPSALAAQAIPLTILYEDADLLVIDKPAGLVVHPAPGNADGTLVNALLAHCGDRLPGIGGERRPGIVHRLDKDTSGVMVVAKSAEAMAALSDAFVRRALDRTYTLLCWGVPSPAEGTVEGAIGRDPRDRKRMAVVARGGKPASTGYRTLRTWGGSASLLECRLATGRTHQIRVHMAARGHPAVGDPLYLRRAPAVARSLPEPVRRILLEFPRQALHAARLAFRHPLTGETMSFETPPPPDFRRLVTVLDGRE